MLLYLYADYNFVCALNELEFTLLWLSNIRYWTLALGKSLLWAYTVSLSTQLRSCFFEVLRSSSLGI